jgi:hypothetical protein
MRSLTTPHRKAAELVTVTDGTSTTDGGGIDALNAQAAAGAGEADGALAAARGLV